MSKSGGRDNYGQLPLVSVIIPVFNGANHIARALDSICDQTYPPGLLEVVVIDDGSTDGSAKIAAGYSDRLRGLQLLVQPNRGVSAARNLGLAVSSGELIAFLDSDDQWLPDKIAAQVEVLKSNPALGLVHCGVVWVDEQGNELSDWSRKSRVDEGDILLEFLCDFFLITSSVMVPQAILDEVGGFNEALPVGEDNELFLRILRRYQAGCVPEPLLRRTVRPDSLSRQNHDLDVRVDLETRERFLDRHPHFALAHKDRLDAHLAEYLYSYGYQLLDAGRVEQARDVLRRSLSLRWSSCAVRSLVRSYLPSRIVEHARGGSR